MKKNLTLFIFLVIIGCAHKAMAFSCTSNGVQVGGAGVFRIPVNVVLQRTDDGFTITDMSKYTTCNGVASFSDALRITDASISSLLTQKGYAGNVTLGSSGSPKQFPVAVTCVWYDQNCTPVNGTYPLQIKIGMSMQSFGVPGAVTLPAGTMVASVTVQQRSNTSWGWDKTWQFVLSNDLVIPAYTCDIAQPDLQVDIPTGDAAEIQANGIGIFKKVKKSFALELSCEPQTYVSAKFTGNTMPGYTNVLANTSTYVGGNKNIGVQMFFQDKPITFGETNLVIPRSQSKETIFFDAYYFYKGGVINGGPVSAMAYYQMTYQ